MNFSIELKGTGLLEENNSRLDVRDPNELKKIEEKFAEAAKESMEKTITKVQTEYGLDIFGFGEIIHRKHPSKWEKLKDDWDDHFSQANIDVKVEINIKEIGLDGPSILMRRSENKQ